MSEKKFSVYFDTIKTGKEYKEELSSLVIIHEHAENIGIGFKIHSVVHWSKLERFGIDCWIVVVVVVIVVE